jgi:DNA-binding NtrC family response regulator
MSTSLHLLIADDNEELTDILSCGFKRLGVTVASCGDADTCVRLFSCRQPDVVLVDGKLPGNDGLWLAKQLRALRPDVPVVMLSGNDDRCFADAAYQAGVVQFLLKPCSLRCAVGGTGSPSSDTVNNQFRFRNLWLKP